jgi:hypothetical protein
VHTQPPLCHLPPLFTCVPPVPLFMHTQKSAERHVYGHEHMVGRASVASTLDLMRAPSSITSHLEGHSSRNPHPFQQQGQKQQMQQQQQQQQVTGRSPPRPRSDEAGFLPGTYLLSCAPCSARHPLSHLDLMKQAPCQACAFVCSLLSLKPFVT